MAVFPYKIQKNSFKVFDNYAILPINLSFVYSIALCEIGKAKTIYLAGFDGYGKGHRLQNQMNEILKLIKNYNKKLKIQSITKTQYKIR